MIKGIYYVSRNMHSKVNNIEIVANNLANINTTGYKRELPFSEIMARFNNSPIKQMTDFSQGTLLFTSNPLDAAISGKGNFVLQNDKGSLEFTRNGRFRISEEGFLVNEQGFKVMGKKGAIDFLDFNNKDKTISIAKNGEIKIDNAVIDELKIVDLDNMQGLDRKEGLNFEVSNDEYKELEEGDFEIQQGYLEESNVNPVLEMQAMIDINKDFEASQKMVNFLDISLEKANEIGKV